MSDLGTWPMWTEEEQKEFFRGIDSIGNRARITLGQKMFFGKPFDFPVATEGEPFADLGAELLKEIAINTEYAAGDGSAIATVLAQSLIKACLSQVSRGADPILIKRGIDKGVEAVVKAIEAQAVRVTNPKTFAQVATLTTADLSLGKTVARTFEAVGADGVITVEESRGPQTQVELVRASEFDAGYISRYMVTDRERMATVFEEPLICVIDRKLISVRDLEPIFARAELEGKPMLIVAEDIEGEALKALIRIKLGGELAVAAVKAPGAGADRHGTLQDIAILTDTSVISDDIVNAFHSIPDLRLGRSRRVIVTDNKLVFMDGAGSQDSVKHRIAEIAADIQKSGLTWEREGFQRRLAKLSGTGAVIRVAAAGETEFRYTEHIVEDAILTARAADRGGVVSGGGIALLDAISSLDGVSADGDERLGVDILRAALEEPTRQIALNSGQNQQFVIDRVHGLPAGWGLDADSGGFVDMFQKGIIDPTQVVQTALQNAATAAGKLLERQSVPPRYVNIGFARNDGSEAIPPTHSLAAKTTYILRMNIGLREKWSTVQEAPPVPTHLLPGDQGHWLALAVFSDEFALGAKELPLFLPRRGASWVCACEPGTKHTCVPEERRPYIELELTTPAETALATIRVSLYYRAHVVQSFNVLAEVREHEMASFGTSAVLDFNLTRKLTDLDQLSEPALSIFVNSNGGETHRMVLRSKDRTVDFTFTEAQVERALGEARGALLAVHKRALLGRLDPGFDTQALDLFKEEDLKAVAEKGMELFVALFAGKNEERKLMRAQTETTMTIQSLLAQSSNFAFHWALLYDVTLTGSRKNWRVCPILDRLVQLSADEDPPRECPHAPHASQTVCPYGFWGFRHIIEQPPSIPGDASLCQLIKPSNKPPQLVVCVDQTLPHKLTKAHISTLQRSLRSFDVKELDTYNLVFDALKRPGTEFIYFYGHAEPELLNVGEAGELIRASDFTQWSDDKVWPDDHWRTTSPLVFINGCESVATSPGTLLGLVRAFGLAYAAGVVGTEIPVIQGAAGQAAEAFWTFMHGGMLAGEALRRLRFELLRRGSLLGLAYTTYCSAQLRLGEGRGLLAA